MQSAGASPPREASAGWTGGRITAFAVTWLSYASYYLGRKGWSAAKKTMEDALGKQLLSGVETAFLASYAIGQYANGWLGDRVGSRWLIGAGMLVSSGACFAFGSTSLGTVLMVAWIANGFAQSTGWPGNVKAMAEWTPPEERGAVMGVWSTCYQVGGIVATNIAARFLRAWGRPWAFYGPALIMGSVGVVVILFLRQGPLARIEPTPVVGQRAHASPELIAARRRLLRSPIIWCYGSSYFFLKLIRYSLLFWLPYYMEKSLHYETVLANDVSTAFEWGGIAGSIAIGYFSDRIRVIPRSAFAALSLVGLAGAFWILVAAGGHSITANVLCLGLVGFLLFGPDTLVSGAAAQDAGGPEAAALAAGLINGIGSVGAIFQEYVTRQVSDRWGWNNLFLTFVGFSMLAALCLVPTFWMKTRRGDSDPVVA